MKGSFSAERQSPKSFKTWR